MDSERGTPEVMLIEMVVSQPVVVYPQLTKIDKYNSVSHQMFMDDLFIGKS